MCQGWKPEERTSEGGWDLASATQPERCALHLTCVLYLSDGGLTQVEQMGGGILVDIHTNCIRL